MFKISSQPQRQLFSSFLCSTLHDFIVSMVFNCFTRTPDALAACNELELRNKKIFHILLHTQTRKSYGLWRLVKVEGKGCFSRIRSSRLWPASKSIHTCTQKTHIQCIRTGIEREKTMIIRASILFTHTHHAYNSKSYIYVKCMVVRALVFLVGWCVWAIDKYRCILYMYVCKEWVSRKSRKEAIQHPPKKPTVTSKNGFYNVMLC